MGTQQLKIECINRLGVLIEKPKRVKILVGGRASTKSTFVADYVLSRIADCGESWCCSREYQNSIEDSVHSLLSDEIDRCGFSGFNVMKSEITHAFGGRAFYRGLARNITSLKGINAHGLWIEEGESLSKQTLKVLTASIRVSAKDAQAAREAGEEIVVPEIWITMNRGSSKDPIAQKYLKRAEKALARCGYYEDDAVMIVQVNYDENPWFLESGLEQERLDDKQNMTQAEYDHKWHGHYSDSVEDAIIRPEWFDACVDAHKKLGFEPRGIEVVCHDPSDTGSDTKGLAYRHGVVFLDVLERDFGDINEGGDWAVSYASRVKPDLFIWDGDGMGVGLRRQFNEAFKNKKVDLDMFRGSNTPDNPDEVYEDGGIGGRKNKKKTNKQTFKNKRAQYYWDLRDRIYRTFLAVTKKRYVDPDELISFSSEIREIDLLRSEICRIPLKHNPSGMIQIMTKQEMKRMGIESPNMADSVMMALANPKQRARAVAPADRTRHRARGRAGY